MTVISLESRNFNDAFLRTVHPPTSLVSRIITNVLNSRTLQGSVLTRIRHGLTSKRHQYLLDCSVLRMLKEIPSNEKVYNILTMSSLLS